MVFLNIRRHSAGIGSSLGRRQGESGNGSVGMRLRMLSGHLWSMALLVRQPSFKIGLPAIIPARGRLKACYASTLVFLSLQV